MSAQLPAADLAQLAETYRLNREWTLNAPGVEAKKRLQEIETIARRLQDALTSRDVSHYFDQNEERPLLADLAHIADFAQRSRGDIPRHWPNSAARCAALSLQLLFFRHGLRFSATANSDAIATLRKVARLAGDRTMTHDAACQWIKLVKKLGKQSTQKRAKGFPSA